MPANNIINFQFFASLIPSFSDEILSAILGASLAFLFSWILQRNAEKKTRSLELIHDYASPDFIDIRNDAGVAIRESFSTFKETNPTAYPSWQWLFNDFEDDDWRKISKIKHFYEKLNYLITIKEVNQKYISGYFYSEFTHWNAKYFSHINNASLKAGAVAELDVSALEKHLHDPKNTWFFPFYMTLSKYQKHSEKTTGDGLPS